MPAKTIPAPETSPDAYPTHSSRYAIPILNALRFQPKNAYRLCEDLSIPIGRVYDTLHALQQLGLVTVFDRLLTREGKRISLYMATVAYAPNPNYARLKEAKELPVPRATGANLSVGTGP